VASDFLLHNLLVEIKSSSNQLYTGSSYYNYNFLEITLQPGSYEVSVIAMDRSPIVNNCVSFNFQFQLALVDECSGSGEPIPNGINTIRFLGGREYEMSYISNVFRVPIVLSGLAHTQSAITIGYVEDSIFRASVVPGAGFDVTLYLQRYSMSNSQWVTLTSTNSHTQSSPNSFTYHLIAGGYYQLVLYFTRLSSVSPCSTFTMELAVGGVNPLPPVCPSQGSYHFNPAFPSVLPGETPYTYSSTIIGEDLFLQQASGHIFYHANTMNISAPANLHVEIAFDFLRGELGLYLENLGSGVKTYGQKSWNRNILHFENLDVGLYKVWLYELTPADTAIMGCNHFTYTVIISAFDYQSIDQLFLTFPPVPNEFNSIGYLGFSHYLHFEENYVFSETSNLIEFTIEEDSYFRLKVSVGENALLSLVIMQESSILFFSAGPLLFVELAPGDYNLLLQPSSLFVQYGLEFEIIPTSRVEASIEFWDSLNSECTTSEWPEEQILFIPGTPYAFGAERLTISPETHGGLVNSLSFRLYEQAFVYAQIDFQFIPNDLDLVLINANLEINYLAEHRKNQAEIYTLLPAGNYSIGLLKFQDSMLEAHCGEYSFVFVISDEQGDREQCYNFLALPSDLNSAHGGSQPYGGPINSDGDLSFMGPSFLFYNSPNHFSQIEFSIHQESMISIFTNSHAGVLQYVAFNLHSGLGVDLISSYSFSSDVIRQQVYRANITTQNAESNYYSTLVIYDSVPLGYTTNCPSYSLQIEISPIAKLISSPCPQTILFPQSHLSVNSNGFGSDFVSSSLPAYALGSTYRVLFSIDQPSNVQVIFQYNQLQIHTNLEIIINPNSNAENIQTGSYIPETLSANTNMGVRIISTLQAGEYAASFTPELVSSLNLQSECVPYIWSIQIFPQVTGPMVSFVDPPNAIGIQPSTGITLDLSFSSMIFADTIRVDAHNKSPMLLAFYLESSNSQARTSISPISATQLGTSGEIWRLHWSPDWIEWGMDYTLELHRNILVDIHNNPIILPSVNQFSVIPQCNVNQTLSENFICVCNPGRTGSDCSLCADGYSGADCIANNICSPPCINGQCQMHVCECNLGWDGVDCSYCALHHQGENCASCSHGWTGSNCDRCALHFQAPDCVSCSAHWTGTNCDQCQTGWAGEDCSECAPHFTGAGSCDQCEIGWSGTNCNQCAPHFLAPDCSQCIYPFTGTDCSQCLPHWSGSSCSQCQIGWAGEDCSECAPHFTGPDCNECQTGWSGTDCSHCAPHFTGDQCDQCVYPFRGENCNECQSHFSGANCDYCSLGWAGEDCSVCADRFTGDSCSECTLGWSNPLSNCTQCAPHFTGEQCNQCVYPFEGPSCDQCSGNFIGEECSFCALGWISPALNCSFCDLHWTGENCDQCQIGWDGPTCNYCAPNFQGSNCDVCVNHWTGDDCSVCPSQYVESPGSCSSCVGHFTGPNCSFCMEGFSGPDCNTVVQIDVHSSDEDPVDVEIAVGISVVAVIVFCVLLAVIVALLRKQYLSRSRRNMSRTDEKPLLDLDDEDAVELDTNPVFDASKYEGDYVDLRYPASSGVPALDDSDEDFEGAIDIDDLDTVNPDEFLDNQFNPR